MQEQNQRVEFFIHGIPAGYSTRREQEWKETIAAQAPSATLAGLEVGIDLRFSLLTLTPRGMSLDVDNLCEPAFSVLVNRLGWFAGARPKIQWWRAAKEVADPPGCLVSVSTEVAPPRLTASADWEEVYEGPLPTSARSPEAARWAADVRHRHAPGWTPVSCTLYLGFSDRSLNLGDIATGRVKSFVDCLYPLLGGRVGAPADDRVVCLIVEKGVEHLPPHGVMVSLWSHGKVVEVH